LLCINTLNNQFVKHICFVIYIVILKEKKNMLCNLVIGTL